MAMTPNHTVAQKAKTMMSHVMMSQMRLRMWFPYRAPRR